MKQIECLIWDLVIKNNKIEIKLGPQVKSVLQNTRPDKQCK